MPFLPVSTPYIIVFALLSLVFSIRVGMVRKNTGISFLDGGDELLLRRMRGHGNFIETVPLALALIALSEANGASTLFVHSMGLLLLVSRLMHYITLQQNPQSITRAIGMIGTFSVYLISSGWLALQAF